MPRTALTFPKRKTPDNLLTNGDFEYAPPFTAAQNTTQRFIDGTASGSANNYSPYTWGFIKGNTATAQFDSTVSKFGTTSMKITTGSSAAYGEVNLYGPFVPATTKNTLIPALPSTTYTISWWMKTEYVSGDASQGATVGLIEYNGVPSSTTFNSSGAATIKTTTDWTFYSYSITTQSTTRFFNVQARIYGHNGTGTLQMNAWFDDITLVKSPVQTRTAVTVAPLPIVNPGFETAPPFTAATNVSFRYIDGTAGGSATDVGYKWSTATTTNSEAKFDSAVKYSGNYSMKLSTLSSGAIVSALQLKADIGFTVKPNTTYMMSYRIKTQVNSGSSASGAYGSITRRKSDNTVVGTTYATSVLTTQDWTTYSFTVTTTPETAYLEPTVSINGSNGAGTLVMDAWFDDIEIKEVIPQRKTPDNLLSNGNFEYAPPFTAAQTSSGWINGTAGGSLSDGYQYGWGLNRSGTATAQYDSTEKKFGTNSLKLSTLVTGSYAEVNKYGSTSAPYYKASVIPALPNTTYTLTWWMKTNYTSGDSQGATVGFVEWNGAYSPTTFNAGTTIKTTTDWTQYSLTVTTASTTRFVNVQPRIYGHTGAATLIMDAWFDDITLTTTAPYRNRKVVDNLVTNGDFESSPTFVAAQTTAAAWIDGTASGSANQAYGWAVASSGLTSSASVNYDTTVSFKGATSLKLSTLNSTGTAIVSTTLSSAPTAVEANTTLIKVLPSTSYTLNAWAKTNNAATNSIYADIRQFTGDRVAVATTSSNKLSGTNDWTQLTVTVTTDATTRYIGILLRNAVSGNVSDAWFDDITLVKN